MWFRAAAKVRTFQLRVLWRSDDSFLDRVANTTPSRLPINAGREPVVLQSEGSCATRENME